MSAQDSDKHITLDPMERGTPATLTVELAHLAGALRSNGNNRSANTVEEAMRELAAANRDRVALRDKLAAAYSILARREVKYGDEVEGLILTAAHVVAKDGIALAAANAAKAGLVEALRANVAAFDAIDKQTPWSETPPKWWEQWAEHARIARAAIERAGG